MTVYVFGGEAYQPQKYHADVWRLHYAHNDGDGQTCGGGGGWLVWTDELLVWEIASWSIVLLLAVVVVLLLRRRVLRQIKTS